MKYLNARTSSVSVQPTVADAITKVSQSEDNDKPSLFYKKADGYLYSKPIEDHSTELTEIGFNPQTIYLPVECDTEFYSTDQDINRTLTVQYRAIALSTGVILSHPDSADIARHPIAKSGFTLVDYLNAIGIPSSIERCRCPEDFPILQIDIYGFFLLAELYRMFTGDYQNDINDLVIGRRDDGAKIEMGRRLTASTTKKWRVEPFVKMPWVIKIHRTRFQVALSFYDTCAVQGKANYKYFCENSGVNLEYKDTFTQSEKANKMKDMYTDRPKDFDNYALGDLYNYPALMGHAEKFKQIYKSIGIESLFKNPRLTIGSTVTQLLTAKMVEHLGINSFDSAGNNISHKEVYKLCKYATSAYLKELKKTTAAYNAKVDGGRCYNNRPTDVSIHKLIADVDIEGCYGNGLLNQLYPFGRPPIIDYPIDSSNNGYLILDKFLKEYRDNLVPGLWQARVIVKPGYVLKYLQDFLISWYPPKDISKMPTDTDLEKIDWWKIDNIGITKIYTKEVHLGIITQDFLDWLDNVASERQRRELLNNLYVVTAMYYPACERVNSPEELFEAIRNHKGENTCQVEDERAKTKKISTEQECHAWYAVNMGELIVGELMKERNKYPKKTPMNDLYKLCINTIYGVMVSPFFKISNVIVGNNITARARAMAWYMEKGLNGFQTITDGCAFEVNRVIHENNRKLTAVELIRKTKRPNYLIKPINGNTIKPQVTDNELGLVIKHDNVLTHKDNPTAKKWLADKVKEHLNKLFPNIPVISMYSFEIKDIYDRAAFHGTANYKLGDSEAKMRSYPKIEFEAFNSTGDEIQLISNEYKPSDEFLDNLLKDPHHVLRSHPCIQEKILKTQEYKNHYYSTWEGSEAFPGCTIKQARLLRECSLNQFTFQTHKQYLSWERESKRLRDKTGQTYESWFLNEDGTLDLQQMVDELDEMIRAGKMRFSQSRKKAKQDHLAREYKDHPGANTLEKIKDELDDKYRPNRQS